MLNFQDLLKKTFLINNNSFIHGISFIVVSLIAIHVAIFFNFYKFSNDWIVGESEKTTFILSKNINEKVIPNDVTSKILNYLENNKELTKFRILDKNLIQESLGIKNIDDIFGLSLPFVFLIQTSNEEIIDEVYTSILKISDNRIVEKYQHKDQLFEVVSLFKRIKVIIFLMLLVISILFAFLVLNITKAALVSNYKFLEMIQIMGESSYGLSKNISVSILKRILPGSIISIIFVSIVSSLLIKFFGVNFYFFSDNFYFEQTLKTLILLIIFILILLSLLLIFLMLYLFYFFEKRFFDKV
ncbi:MAG: hypothetical protein ACJ0G0_02460 [Alphaproteobacteria bacterium]|tara:strand:+ start:12179 stop:13078 length:900 start_codon:yes stop_codon:yes gene_type:complete